jgi:outer membrane protein OmpA-like peptidoglycan-associated protein
MRRGLLFSLSLVTFLVPTTGARADAAGASRTERAPSYRLEAIGGGHFFAQGTNLGVAAAPEASAGAKSNALAGLRAGFGLGSSAAAEVEIFGMRTPDRTYDLRADIFAYRLSLLAFILSGELRPFMLVGAGVIEVATTHADGKAGLVRDRDAEFHVGLGLDYTIGRYLSVRADGRVVQMPGKQEWSLASDFEATLGLGVRFGATPPSAPPGEPSPPPLPPNPPGGQGAAPVEAVSAPAPESPAATVVAPAAAAAPVVARPPQPGKAVSEPPAARAVAPAAAAAPGPAPVADPVASAGGTPPLPPATSADSTTVKELLGRSKEIKFEGSSSKLSLTSLPLIGQLAEALVREPGVQLEIVSHTASSGDAAKDLALSKRRADAVRNALVDREVGASRLIATGRGSEEPLVPSITRSGRKMNERVELRLQAPDKPAR